MINVDLVFFDAGGGHRAAAEALRLVMEEQGGWNVRLVNLQELLDPIDLVRKLTGLRMQDLYNLMLKKGWTLGTPQTVRVLQFLHPPAAPAAGAVAARSSGARPTPTWWSPLVPHFNRAIAESLRHVRPATPFVTVLTDIADYPPHFWMERAGAILHLRLGPRRRAGARPGHQRQPDFSSLGHDPAPALLSAHLLRPARGAETARA